MAFDIRTKGEGDTLVFLIGYEQELATLGELENTTLVAVNGFDWDADLSPWYMPKIFKKGNDFAGHGEALLAALTAEVFIPLITDRKPARTMIVGYSLAGLFALYACTKSSLFDACASISGSLWYSGWIEYLQAHPVQAKSVYLSLGADEKNARSQVFASVEERTIATQAIINAYTPCTFALNEGGHMSDEAARIEKGIRFLL